MSNMRDIYECYKKRANNGEPFTGWFYDWMHEYLYDYEILGKVNANPDDYFDYLEVKNTNTNKMIICNGQSILLYQTNDDFEETLIKEINPFVVSDNLEETIKFIDSLLS